VFWGRTFVFGLRTKKAKSQKTKKPKNLKPKNVLTLASFQPCSHVLAF